MHPFLRCTALATTFAALLLAANSPARAQTAPAASTAAAAKTYHLNLSPTLKVGQKLGLVSSSTMNMDMNITVSAPALPAPQTQQQKQAGVIHLEADCEVLAVTTEGQAKKLAVTIKSLTATQDGKAVPGLPKAGDKIIAEKAGKNDVTLTQDDKPLSAELTQLIGDSLPLEIDGRNDQARLGPKTPVAVGATWDTGPALLAELQESMPSATGIQGQMKLDSMQGSGDSQVAKISGKLTVVGVTAPLPPPLSAIPAQCSVQISGSYPIGAKGVFDETFSVDTKFSGETDANGAHVKMDATTTQNVAQTITLP